MKRFFLFSLFVGIILTSCTSQRIIYLKSSFDKEQARSMLDEGSSKIIGSALIKQVYGGVVTCAGCEVVLYPATDYAKERIDYIYGNDNQAYKVFKPSPNVTRGNRFGNAKKRPDYIFEPDYKSYHNVIKKTIGDAQGSFEFDKLKDGEYFIFTTIYWGGVYPLNLQGGTLMLRVSVKDNEIKKVVLAP